MTPVMKPKICDAWGQYKVFIISYFSKCKLTMCLFLHKQLHCQDISTSYCLRKTIIGIMRPLVECTLTCTIEKRYLGCEGCALWFCLKITMFFPTIINNQIWTGIALDLIIVSLLQKVRI